MKGAVRAFRKVYRINPEDEISYYYASYIQNLIDGNPDKDKIFPLSFEKEYPKKIVKDNNKVLKEFKIDDASNIVKSPKNREKLLWGVKYGDKKTIRKCCAIICLAEHKPSIKKLLNFLLEPDFNDETKRRIIFTLLVCGRRSKFGVVCDNCYIPIKPRKTLFLNDEYGSVFNSAYALTVSKAIFMGIDDVEKITFKANRLYKKYAKIIFEANCLVEDVSSLIIYDCNFKHFEDLKTICSSFGGNYEKLLELSIMIKGE